MMKMMVTLMKMTVKSTKHPLNSKCAATNKDNFSSEPILNPPTLRSAGSGGNGLIDYREKNA